MKTRSLQALILLSGFSVMLLTGCRLAPAPVESHFYNVTTNTVPVVTIESVTNQATQEIVWTQTTNNVVTYTYTANTNAGQLSATAGAITSILGGPGELVAAGVAGLFGVWGAMRSRKAQKYVDATGALAKTIEVFREVLKTTPQGQALNEKLTVQMVKHQIEIGVIREVAAVVLSQVNNATAKQVADALLRELTLK